jgi:hypothetical protein
MEIVTSKKRRVDAYSFAQLKYKFLIYFNTAWRLYKEEGNLISAFEKADSDSQ